LQQEIRLVLSDGQWKRIEKLCVGKPEDPGGTGADNRMFVEAVLWIARTGSPWRDLPNIFGKWNSVFVRFNRWSEGGVWQRIFTALANDPDFEYLILDSTKAIEARAVIPSNPSRALKLPLDKHIYKERHLVECCFNKLKHFRRIATRYEKTARNFLAIITVAAIALWLR
jgi:putative transposase